MGKDGEHPNDYKKARVHFVFDVSGDGRHKAMLAICDDFTEMQLSSAHSGEVSLGGIRLVLFYAELNGLEPWGEDACNACLESKTE